MGPLTETARNEIKQRILDYGSIFSEWFVGVSEDPHRCLQVEHHVDEKKCLCICRECSSSEEARWLERYFVYTLGTDGHPGQGEETARYIFAYKKRSGTVE